MVSLPPVLLLARSAAVESIVAPSALDTDLVFPTIGTAWSIGFLAGGFVVGPVKVSAFLAAVVSLLAFAAPMPRRSVAHLALDSGAWQGFSRHEHVRKGVRGALKI